MFPLGSLLSAVWGQASGLGAGRDLCPLAPHPLEPAPVLAGARAGTSSSNVFTRAGSSGASAARSRSLGFLQK